MLQYEMDKSHIQTEQVIHSLFIPNSALVCVASRRHLIHNCSQFQKNKCSITITSFFHTRELSERCRLRIPFPTHINFFGILSTQWFYNLFLPVLVQIFNFHAIWAVCWFFNFNTIPLFWLKTLLEPAVSASKTMRKCFNELCVVMSIAQVLKVISNENRMKCILCVLLRYTFEKVKNNICINVAGFWTDACALWTQYAFHEKWTFKSNLQLK